MANKVTKINKIDPPHIYVLREYNENCTCKYKTKIYIKRGESTFHITSHYDFKNAYEATHTLALISLLPIYVWIYKDDKLTRTTLDKELEKENAKSS